MPNKHHLPALRCLDHGESNREVFVLHQKLFILLYGSFFISFGCALANLKQLKIQFLPPTSLKKNQPLSLAA